MSQSPNRPAIAALIIFDGWGLRQATEANAICKASTPVMDRLWATQAHSEIDASGESVGLPPGIMGNSEVGHLTIGTGRVIYQDLMRITKAIETGAFFKNDTLCSLMHTLAHEERTLHLWGLVSDGGVHSHIDHLLALIEMAASEDVADIAVHAVLDGRGRIATVSGRYFAMDRDKRWDRVERAWRAIVMGGGLPGRDAREVIEAAYAKDQSDEFLEPHVIGDPRAMRDGDGVVCFNFRADRARELTEALTSTDFKGFERPQFPKINYVCMTEYERRLNLPLAFGPEEIHNMLAEIFARDGLRNLRIAETEKYAHVTYFLNGGVEKPFPLEERILIPSSKVATYDLEPAMQAVAIARRAAEEIAKHHFDVIVLNFANPDMVGHTGNMEATVRAVEESDKALGIVLDAIDAAGGVALITADHGNAEFMADPATGQPHTAHTINPVPLIVCDRRFKGRLADGGALSDVAPTFLAMLGISKPPEMTGRDLREPAS
jgi:2,3-bisphosphoglycerate-independent phosphoglycerate mutase